MKAEARPHDLGLENTNCTYMFKEIIEMQKLDNFH
jgi:hypothetical protein